MSTITDNRIVTPAEIIALARQAQEGKREAAEALRVAVAEARHPGQVKMLWVDIESECGCRTICLACEFGDEYEHDHDRAFLWPCAPMMVKQRNGGGCPILKPCPDWTTDIAAAFELGEEAKKRGKDAVFGLTLLRIIGDSPFIGPHRSAIVFGRSNWANRAVRGVPDRVRRGERR